MKITNYYTYKQPQFQAIKVAKTNAMLRGESADIDIYRLTKSDNAFLKNLQSKTSYAELFPKLNEILQERWQKIFNYCITQAINDSDCSYIAVCNNKPCGIMTYYNTGNSLYLDGICSIPIEKNKKLPNIGKSLFCQLFKDAKDKKLKNITLSAVQDGPFDVIKKYEEMGFKKDITSYPYTEMKCNKYTIEEESQKLRLTTNYVECEEKSINLNEVSS